MRTANAVRINRTRVMRLPNGKQMDGGGWYTYGLLTACRHLLCREAQFCS
jgi:hypothetical protein